MTMFLCHVILSFHTYNEDYFGGILPMPRFKIRHGWYTLGYFHCYPDAPLGTTETIEISDFYDYTNEQLRDIIIHEMIHYYLYYTGEDPNCRHGKAFKRMANQFNTRYGMNITPTIDISRMKSSENANKIS